MSRVGALSAIVALFSSTLFAELAFSRLQLALDPRLCALFCRLWQFVPQGSKFLSHYASLGYLTGALRNSNTGKIAYATSRR